MFSLCPRHTRISEEDYASFEFAYVEEPSNEDDGSGRWVVRLLLGWV
jgi:hypothetical protein